MPTIWRFLTPRQRRTAHIYRRIFSRKKNLGSANKLYIPTAIIMVTSCPSLVVLGLKGSVCETRRTQQGGTRVVSLVSLSYLIRKAAPA